MNQSFEWRSQSRLLDEVAQALRERIYAGVYAPGATLRQEKIAAEFGIDSASAHEELAR
jgi:DNA-binding GntR family transcriptional regulator